MAANIWVDFCNPRGGVGCLSIKLAAHQISILSITPEKPVPAPSPSGGMRLYYHAPFAENSAMRFRIRSINAVPAHGTAASYARKDTVLSSSSQRTSAALWSASCRDKITLSQVSKS